MSKQSFLIAWVVAVLLSACVTAPTDNPTSASSTDSGLLDGTPVTTAKPKPSIAKTEATRMKVVGEKDWRPATHQVLKGDTMYSIAFYYGLDYHELAELNGIKDPSVIQVGQVLRLFAAAAKSADAKTESKLINAPKDQPKVVKYAYSEAAMAKIDGVQTSNGSNLATALPPKPSSYSVPGATIEVISLPHKGEAAASSVKSVAQAEPTAMINTEEDTLQWGLPATGKIVGQFSEAANRKGIDIAGKLGQEILASAPGKVVYSGSGLRGYGKLVIIKHNKTYLSAYAHNDKVLVKEGQMVKRGEKIAEMGKTDADQVKLHFEVRRLGKPVDPAKYLPKS